MMRIVNPDQVEYSGLIQLAEKEAEGGGNGAEASYPYGITSLVDKRDVPQKGELVRFKAAFVKSSGKQRAARVVPLRLIVRGKVDSLKGQVRKMASL